MLGLVIGLRHTTRIRTLLPSLVGEGRQVNVDYDKCKDRGRYRGF